MTVPLLPPAWKLHSFSYGLNCSHARIFFPSCPQNFRKATVTVHSLSFILCTHGDNLAPSSLQSPWSGSSHSPPSHLGWFFCSLHRSSSLRFSSTECPSC